MHIENLVGRGVNSTVAGYRPPLAAKRRLGHPIPTISPICCIDRLSPHPKAEVRTAGKGMVRAVIPSEA